MRHPDTLENLLHEGIIDEVVRPLLAGKEAQIWWVTCNGTPRVAKVYKEAHARSFHQRADYTEGRRGRNSRDQRAMRRGSRYGRAQAEEAWRSMEVDTIFRLQRAGVRVPEPHHFIDGVLIMEMVMGADGLPAPRLCEASFTPKEAAHAFDHLLGEAVRMLCAGIVHGDLSDFNVLMSAKGPVIIDFPQAVLAAENLNARKIFLRDIDNLHRFRARHDPHYTRRPYGEEIWQHYQAGTLSPTFRPEGRYVPTQHRADTTEVLGLIREAHAEAAHRAPPRGPQRAGPRTPRGANRGPHTRTGPGPAHAPQGPSVPRQAPPHQDAIPQRRPAPSPQAQFVEVLPGVRRRVQAPAGAPQQPRPRPSKR